MIFLFSFFFLPRSIHVLVLEAAAARWFGVYSRCHSIGSVFLFSLRLFYFSLLLHNLFISLICRGDGMNWPRMGKIEIQNTVVLKIKVRARFSPSPPHSNQFNRLPSGIWRLTVTSVTNMLCTWRIARNFAETNKHKKICNFWKCPTEIDFALASLERGMQSNYSIAQQLNSHCW